MLVLQYLFIFFLLEEAHLRTRCFNVRQDNLGWKKYNIVCIYMCNRYSTYVKPSLLNIQGKKRFMKAEQVNYTFQKRNEKGRNQALRFPSCYAGKHFRDFSLTLGLVVKGLMGRQ